ncbi:helix-turn-helix domain-containing protein [Nostoc sp. CHAB 5784]|nr:helix-turn-helix domain-containing protein [Nostoc mirabile]MCC5665125.1 helix-turn-helix domain-containing protein [Nostoc mirabile CHAB5784]
MIARYQYRFYPTNRQQQSLAQLFGCVRASLERCSRYLQTV